MQPQLKGQRVHAGAAAAATVAAVLRVARRAMSGRTTEGPHVRSLCSRDRQQLAAFAVLVVVTSSAVLIVVTISRARSTVGSPI
jgi:hypothetical protein